MILFLTIGGQMIGSRDVKRYPIVRATGTFRPMVKLACGVVMGRLKVPVGCAGRRSLR